MQPALAIKDSLTRGDTPQEIASDIALTHELELIPTLLDVLCESTGLRFAAVARVTDKTWVACVVKDNLGFGAVPGSELEVESTLCIEAKRANATIAVDSAANSATYRNHPTVKRNNLGSFITVPIVLPNGQYFGNLCAHDVNPSKVTTPEVLSMFKHFADLVGVQLNNEKNRRIAEEALLAAKQESLAREQAMAILAHDLRNPLQAIFTTGSVLERSVKDPLLLSKTARIRTTVTRMSKLIDVVLDFARGQFGSGIEVQLESSQTLGASIEAVVKEFQDAYPDRQILSEIHLTCPVRCDLPRIQQVISNLIGNAVTHGASAYPIKLKGSVEANEVVLEVWNLGEPILESHFGNLFEPFWQRRSSAGKQGLGLGLYICAKIIHAHQGSIEVSSSLEKGTAFTVRLPLYETP